MAEHRTRVASLGWLRCFPDRLEKPVPVSGMRPDPLRPLYDGHRETPPRQGRKQTNRKELDTVISVLVYYNSTF